MTKHSLSITRVNRIPSAAVQGIFLVLTAMMTPPVSAQTAAQPAAGDVNHAAVIQNWDQQAYQRGEQIYQSYCYACHGKDGTAVVPNARSFNADELKAGNDPYTMWQTLTNGYNQMLPQLQYTPQERYDVIHYIREAIVKPNNPGQYFEITQEYLKSLPGGDTVTAKAPEKIEIRGHPRDYGPALVSHLRRDFNRVLTVKLGQDIFLSYDLHRMLQAAVWEGFLNLDQTHHMKLRGEGQAVPDGDMLDGLQTYHWAYGDSLDPPKANETQGLDDSYARGPISSDKMVFHGYYRYWEKVALAYAIQGRDVREMPGLHRDDDFIVLINTLRVEPGDNTLKLCVGKLPESESGVIEGVFPLRGAAPGARTGPGKDNLLVAGEWSPKEDVGTFVAAGISGQTDIVQWEVDNQHRLALHILPSDRPRTFQIYRVSGSGGQSLKRFARYVDSRNQLDEWNLPNMQAFTNGGPRLWRETVSTQGQINVPRLHYLPMDAREGTDLAHDERRIVIPQRNPAYVMDSIELPVDNPWNSWMRPSAIDCFEDGRTAICTYGGDVWIASGLDEQLSGVRWSRFAAGLYEPMGLEIVDGKIMLTCKDGIYRLHDLNDNGEADYYESFYTDPEIANGFHSFSFCLERDSEGNFYYAKNGHHTDFTQPGIVRKISPDGKTSDIIALGFRVPNGMGIDKKTDTIYVTDNQGEWTPANKINVVPKNPDMPPWYGFSQTEEKYLDRDFVPPMLWLPQEFDNSPGSQIAVYDERWGPLRGKLIHTSFGKGWMYYIMRDEVDGVKQAAAVAFPYQFDAGLQRLAFNQNDGHVYTVGLTGWDTEAVDKDGCFGRLRYTGSNAPMLLETHIRENGIEFTFNFEIEAQSAKNPENYLVEQWNYRWTSDYGSAHWSVKNPKKVGEDRLKAKSVELSADKRTLLLNIPGLQPVDQMHVRMNLQTQTGETFRESVYLTINKAPGAKPGATTVARQN